VNQLETVLEFVAKYAPLVAPEIPVPFVGIAVGLLGELAGIAADAIKQKDLDLVALKQRTDAAIAGFSAALDTLAVSLAANDAAADKEAHS
jgi:hypothetical protein